MQKKSYSLTVLSLLLALVAMSGCVMLLDGPSTCNAVSYAESFADQNGYEMTGDVGCYSVAENSEFATCLVPTTSGDVWVRCARTLATTSGQVTCTTSDVSRLPEPGDLDFCQ